MGWLSGLLRNQPQKNFLVLLSGTIVAQAIPLLALPVLSRIYLPSDFGQLALFVSVVSMLSLLTTCRVEMALMLPTLPKNLKLVFDAAIKLTCYLCGIIAAALLMAAVFGLYFVSKPMTVVLAITLIAIGLYSVFRQYLVKNESYITLAKNRVEQSAVTAGSQLLLSFANLGGAGLILGFAFGQLIATFRLHMQINEKYGVGLRFSLQQLAILRRYSNIMLKGGPATFISRLASESFIILLGLSFTTLLVGYISLLLRVITIPASLIGANLADVFYQNLTKLNPRDGYPLIKNFMVRLILVSVPLYAVLYAFLAINLSLLFGREWEGAVEFIPYIIIISTFSFVYAPLAYVFDYLDIQGFNIVWQSAWLISNIIVFWVSDWYSLTLHDVLLIYSVKQVFLYFIGILFVWISARRAYTRQNTFVRDV